MGDGRRVLTQRQAAILACIRESVEQRGYPPTVREIGATVGLSSTSAVKHQLDALAAAGYIVRDPRVARTITVLPPPALTVADDNTSPDTPEQIQAWLDRIAHT